VWLRRGIEANRNFPFTHFFLSAVLASLGALDDARAAVQAAGFTILTASWASTSI
jgi:hypothetical protein